MKKKDLEINLVRQSEARVQRLRQPVEFRDSGPLTAAVRKEK